MGKLRKMQRGSAVGRGLNRVLSFGVRRGMRSVEVNPEDFRKQLADKHALWCRISAACTMCRWSGWMKLRKN